MKSWIYAALFTALLVAGCGGGDSPTQNKGPDVVIFFVSGHTQVLDGSPSYSYLDVEGGPDIVNALQAQGLTVESHYYVDDAYQVGGFGGFTNLLADLRSAKISVVPTGSKIVVVAHSHGGVWAHAAIQQISDLPVKCMIDLDTSSAGWNLVGHDTQSSFIGGNPVSRYSIPYLASYPQYNVVSDQSSFYDLEDVVFQNVQYALEVRSGDYPTILSLEQYDQKWNIRADGSTLNLFGYYSGTTHQEVHQTGGTTLAFVKTWLAEQIQK